METHILDNDYFFSIVENELEQGKDVEFTVKGFSMLPYIRNMKDNVILYPCKTKDLHKLDFVLFRFHEKHILHRIVKIEDGHYTMQGDGVYASKEYCSADDIVGVVKYIVRNGRKVSVNNKWYRCYVKTWYHLRFMRKYLLYGYRAMTKLTEIISR